MADSDFKDEHHATREQAISAMRVVHTIVEPLGYYASLYGGSLVKPKGGHDVDLHVMGLGKELELKRPDDVSLILVNKLARSLRLFDLYEVDGVMDAYVAFVLINGIYLDVHVKGSA